MKFLPFILKNILRNKVRTALTLASIGISLLLFTVMLTALAAMEHWEHRSDKSHRIAVHHKMSVAFTLPESYRQKLERTPGIIGVCPFTWYGGIYRDPKNLFTTLSVDPDTLVEVWGDQFEFVPEQWEDFKRTRTGASVGRITCEKFGWKVGDTITLTGTVRPVNLTFKLCAIPKKDFDPRAMFFHRKYLEEALGNPGIVSNFWCRVDKPEEIPAVMARVDEQFRNSEYETLAETEKSFASTFLSMMGNIKAIVTGIGLIVVVTIMLVAANSVAMSVRERTMEVAVLKAIGFKTIHILLLVLGESTLVAFLGGILGCGGAFLLFSSPALAAKMGPLSVLFIANPKTLIQGLAIAVTIGAVSGFVPAVIASRTRIVDALRQVA